MLACNDPPPYINLCDLIVAGKPRSHTKTSFFENAERKIPTRKARGRVG